MQTYDYIIVGAGIAGCSVAFELNKISQNILLIDKNEDVAKGASGAAGAFLSPLLGKPNPFKELVTKALKYSVSFYEQHCPNLIDRCGTTRIPKDNIDREKFQSYIPFMDFPYSKEDDGYFFSIGSVLDSYGVCKYLAKEVQTKFEYKIEKIEYKDQVWVLNDSLSCKNLILTTGYEMDLCPEQYIKIRPVWGRRIDIKTSTFIAHNYHKSCSLSRWNNGIVCVGATHHREKFQVDDIKSNHQELLKKVNDIKPLENIEIIKDYVGARASSFDYFPIVGQMVDMKNTLKQFPYLVNGTQVPSERFTQYKNLYIFNGVGGRGFVLGLYLAKKLVENITQDKPLEQTITSERLFLRYVKKLTKEKADEILANS